MKKKIKDLTIQERERICHTHKCSNCPFEETKTCFRYSVKEMGDENKEIDL